MTTICQCFLPKVESFPSNIFEKKRVLWLSCALVGSQEVPYINTNSSVLHLSCTLFILHIVTFKSMKPKSVAYSLRGQSYIDVVLA